MDTREKILSPARCLELCAGAEPFTAITGHFDLLLASTAQSLAAIREQNGGRRLLVLIEEGGAGFFPLEARAALIAALRVVDYVVPLKRDEAPVFWKQLAVPVLSSEIEAGSERSARFREHVLERHGR